jgi:hypothetical protein
MQTDSSDKNAKNIRSSGIVNIIEILRKGGAL